MASNTNNVSNNIFTHVQDNLLCPICYECLKEPVETECCHNIFCRSCLQRAKDKCPYCNKECLYAGSLVHQRILDNFDHECEFCKVKLKKGEIKNHNLKCEKFQQSCPTCKNKIDQASFMNHLNDTHRHELMRSMNPIVENFVLKNVDKKEIVTINTQQNSNYKMAQLGINGKYYCGTNLYGPKCECCKGVCGGTNMDGCNCSACMELDLKARNLPKGSWLVNCEGFNAKKSAKNGFFYCGRKVLKDDRSCGPDGENCVSCSQLNKMEKNTYKQLLNQSKKILKRNTFRGGLTMSKNSDSNVVFNLICLKCNDFCNDPVKTECCQRLFCYICLEQNKSECSSCKIICKFERCIASKRMIENLPHDCINCNKKITIGDIEDHNLICESMPLDCPVCKISFSRLELVTHLIRMHTKELMRNMDLIIENYAISNKTRSEKFTIDPMVNSNGKMAKLGKTGKYYCGSRLDGPRCLCCDGVCGELTGCNCSSCMKLDLKARNLPFDWLVNSDGFNSRKSNQDGLFYCGRKCRIKKNDTLGFCGPFSGKNCLSCKRLDLLAKERYGAIFQAKKSYKKLGLSNFFGSIGSKLLNPFDYSE